MEMEEVIKNIFRGIIKKEDGVEIRRQEFVKVFPDPKVFENEQYVFAALVKEYPKLSLSATFVEAFLNANRPILENSRNIDLQRFKITDTDTYAEFVNSCLSLHTELQKGDVINETFMESLEVYKMNYINEESIKILEESVQVLSTGIKDRGKTVVGYEDMRSYLKNGFHKLDELTANTERRGLITYGINDEDDAESEKDSVKKIADYGIKSLDEHMGGIFEGEMISLLAPAKGGKSRMATFMLHNALVNNGASIVMWSIENGYKGWEALIRARHFETFYNETLSSAAGRKMINDDIIRKGSMDPETKKFELASWVDLKTNPRYGKITSIDEEFNIDTFIEVIDNAVKATGAKIICIDYLQLVQGSGRVSKQERVAEAYQKMLQYLKANRVAGIFPAQLKQVSVGDLSKTDEADLVNKELRDAAGESYEVIKTPDVNLALYGTTEELKSGRMKLLSIPSRNHAPFDPINLYCSLGTCTFVDVAEDVTR